MGLEPPVEAALLWFEGLAGQGLWLLGSVWPGQGADRQFTDKASAESEVWSRTGRAPGSPGVCLYLGKESCPNL